MRLQRIHAKNYRTLENVIVHFRSNYCTISGHNNAGKSCVIRLVLHLLHNEDRNWRPDSYRISYDDDKTKWAKDTQPIEIEYELTLNKIDDSALVLFLEKLSGEIYGIEVSVKIKFSVNSSGSTSQFLFVNHSQLDDISCRNFLKTLRSSTNLLSHNSTERTSEYYYAHGRMTMLYDFFLSSKDRASLSRAESELQKQANKVAKEHKNALGSMLGKLKDRLEVEFTIPDIYSSKSMPLSINLKDRNVEVPLTSWGSGTQNRTHILLSILGASRIRSNEAEHNRTTPIVLVEEPESFLHPTAQAEFGSVLQALSEEYNIQIIASTHSPFMLNQVAPSSNILLKRNTFRGRLQDTKIEETSGDEWMRPFAEHLGIIPTEFNHWKDIIASGDKCLLLVEGELDKMYLSFLIKNFPAVFGIPDHVTILPYGGTGALRNTTMISFVKKVIPRVFITFDLDAEKEAKPALEKIGLQDKRDFVAIGRNRAGKRSIEGLLPDRILQSVYAREIDLVGALQDPSEDRNSARSRLKRKLYDEFTSSTAYTSEELKEFESLAKTISKAFEQN